ncbi:MAG TPA: caspase family protein [Leptolyngbyaceae cyanobacterium]
MKRRHFLQFAGSSLAAIGLSQVDFTRQAHRYGRALAQSTPRKLALLVGVNSYPDPAISDLQGCLNDVEMQYQLLVHRFGFKPQDILKVTDNEALKPSRANILQAFEEHLIKQAKPGDVVVFHYSGHGSLVRDPDPITVQSCATMVANTNGTLVPNDAIAPDQTGQELIVPDIMGRSLFLLTERVQTENLTMVLDSCFSGAGTRGNAVVRSVNARLARRVEDFVASAEEYENQARWLRELKLEKEEFQRRRASGIAKGVALGSASCNQLSFELPYDKQQSAGTFTYLLTSYLWQSPAMEPAKVVQANLIRSTRSVVTQGNQVPIFEYEPGTQNDEQPVYFAKTVAPFAAGVVTNVVEQEINVWLGGVSHANLNLASPDAIYTLLDQSGTELGDIVLTSRTGLQGFGRLAEGQSVSVTPGMLLREKVAAIPDPSLKVGLDASLGGDLAEAQETLQAAFQASTKSGQPVSRLIIVPVDQQFSLEYILARTTEALQQQLRQAGETDPPPLGTIALFTADFSRVIPNTFGSSTETITAAVNRLKPRFRTLLVGKVLRDLAGTSSELQVSGEVFTTEGGPVIPILSRSSQRDRTGVQATAASSQPFRAGDTIQIKVKNQEPSATYLSVLAIGSEGEIVVLHPANWDAPVEAARIDADEELVVPRASDNVVFRVSGAGFVELLTIVSQQPLRRLLQSMQTISRGVNRSRGAIAFEEGDPFDVVSELLSDVDDISRSGSRASIVAEATSTDASAVDSGAVAAFSTLIEVVD